MSKVTGLNASKLFHLYVLEECEIQRLRMEEPDNDQGFIDAAFKILQLGIKLKDAIEANEKELEELRSANDDMVRMIAECVCGMEVDS